MELLPYINCPTYRYRAVGIYCCHTNLKKLLPCIKWHIHYGIAAVYQLSNISLQAVGIYCCHTNLKKYCHVFKGIYIMDLLSILTAQHTLTEQMTYITVTKTLNIPAMY